MNRQKDSTSREPIEPKRRKAGRRKMTTGRRLAYAAGRPILVGLVRILWWTYRVKVVEGEAEIERVVADDQAYVPATGTATYWSA